MCLAPQTLRSLPRSSESADMSVLLLGVVLLRYSHMMEARLDHLMTLSVRMRYSFSMMWQPLAHWWSAQQSRVHRLGKMMLQMMMRSQDDLCHRFNASATLFVSIAVYMILRSVRQASTPAHIRLAPLNYLGVESSPSGYQGDDPDGQTHHLFQL